jgi:hypothetical protein
MIIIIARAESSLRNWRCEFEYVYTAGKTATTFVIKRYSISELLPGKVSYLFTGKNSFSFF